MGGDRPKVLYEVAGRPMVWWVVRACLEAGVARCIVVVAYHDTQVQAALAAEPCCAFVEQTEQLGTGHATQSAEGAVNDGTAPGASGGGGVSGGGDLFVLAGDGPLIRATTLRKLLDVHRRAGAAATLATAVIDNPTGYGRVVRHPDGSFKNIVEHKDATAAELAIHEVNPSYYCFRSDLLFAALRQVRNDNRQKEYYLTDVPAILQRQGHKVAVVDAVPPQDVLSINTPQELAAVDAILRRRLAGAPSVVGGATGGLSASAGAPTPRQKQARQIATEPGNPHS
jgi:bifunctional N-acetylglucosamine-1-phosphate-uridyltransferase/glucosamine-1-phosphate-acetyltransferase GlmU-like protein